MRSCCHAVLLLFCIPAVLVAADPATQPVVDARAILESVVRQFNSAQRMAITYRYDETSTPVEDDVDEMVAALAMECDCTLYVNRPNGLDFRKMLALQERSVAPLRFVFTGENVFMKALGDDDRSLFVVPAGDAGTIEQVFAGPFQIDHWFQGPFVWLIHGEGWKHYFSYASKVRHIGWVRNIGRLTEKPITRIAFSMFDGSDWEMWVDQAAGDRLLRMSIHEPRSTGFAVAKPASERTGGVAMMTNDDIARQRTVSMRLERRFRFETIDVDPKFPEDAFTPPKGEPTQRDDPFRNRRTVVGVAVPDVIGRTRQGDEVKLEQFLGEPFVMLNWTWKVDSLPDQVISLRRHLAIVAREGLGGHAAGIVVLVSAEPGDAINNLLSQPEFQGVTVVVAEPNGSVDSVFEGRGIAVIGRDGRVAWASQSAHALGFPRFAEALANAAER